MDFDHYTLYGMQASLYTGKVRAYMRRNHIPVLERGAGHPDFSAKIMPEIKRFIMPVIVTPNGEIIQDGSNILDYFEAHKIGHEPLRPDDPVVAAIAYLLELFGNEGLLRPAMHYRWNFDAENLHFLKRSFADVLPAGLDQKGQEQMFDFASGKMRKAAVAFGVTPETFETVEKSYAEFLGLLNTHLSRSYFMLGGEPTLADYGLFNPLYAHLSRDPKPADLMKQTAPYVYNWVERMNSPEQRDEHTIKDAPQKLFTAAELPQSLLNILTYVSEEYLAEMTAHIEFANDWLAQRPDLETGTSGMEKLSKRDIGRAEFKWRGHDIKTVVMPYRFYLLQRLQDHFDDASSENQTQIRGLFSKHDLEPFLDLRTSRRVERSDHLEVWGR